MLLLISSQINTVKSFKFMDSNFRGFVYLTHLLKNENTQLQNKTFKC